MDKEKLEAMANIIDKVRAYQGWKPLEADLMKKMVVEWVSLFNKYKVGADEYQDLLDKAILKRMASLKSGDRPTPLTADYILAQSSKSRIQFMW